MYYEITLLPFDECYIVVSIAFLHNRARITALTRDAAGTSERCGDEGICLMDYADTLLGLLAANLLIPAFTLRLSF